MKKAIAVILLCFLILLPFSFEACAESEVYDQEFFEDSIFSSFDSDVSEILHEFGITSLSPDEVFSVSFSDIGNYFSETLGKKTKDILKNFMLLLSVVILASAINTYILDKNNEDTVDLIASSAICLITVSIVNPLINMLLCTMRSSGSFMLAFIPIMTLLLSLGGTPASALTYNSVTFAFAEGISAFLNGFAINIIGSFLCIGISFSLNKAVNFNRFINAVNRTVSFFIGFVASMFAGILSIRGVMSVAADSVSSRGVRFLLSSLIPIVGSSISEAYSSLLGSINIIKGSVAAVGIIVILIISLPPIVEALLYCIGFSVLSYISEMFECVQISNILRAFYSAIRFLILMNILEIFLLIISTGLVISVKGGV